MVRKTDYLVIGSGLAGLYTAHKASEYGSVLVVTKKGIRESNSYFAQGGIAAVTTIEDNPEIHFSDTIIAGRGLCEDKAVNILVNEGPERIKELIEEGMQFDQVDGHLALGLEGGHHRRRILHAGGDSTGKFITEFLISKVTTDKNISVRENMSAIELLVKDGVCYGVRCWDEENDEEALVYADNVFLTSGGTSAIFTRTTNPQTTIGDGLSMAYNAGCRVMDMEFIQFHPSALYLENSSSAFLISEAVRGEGAHLLGKDGRRFMLPIHELAELAPRDIVARSIFRQMQKDDSNFVTLSLSHLKPDLIKARFPNIYQRCKENGYDLTDTIPIAPAAHYTVGGVASGSCGESDIQHLYVCGEIASTGIMGANRLASNSLIECLVFANRAILKTRENVQRCVTPDFALEYHKNEENKEAYLALKERVAQIMNTCSGIVRSYNSLSGGLLMIDAELAKIDKKDKEFYTEGSRKLLTVAKLIMTAAKYRKESRGGHYREDFPTTREEYAVHTIQQIGTELKTSPVNK